MKILVTGAGGMLAHAVVPAVRARDHDVHPFDRAQLDVTDAAAVDAMIRRVRPDAVIQCAAYTRVDDAEQEEDRAHLINAQGAATVADACASVGARFVYPSTDYVFDGAGTKPYAVDTPTAPVNAYGRSKCAGERALAGHDALVVRTSWLYGPGGRNFITTILARARAGQSLRVVDDQQGAPTYTADLARTIVLLLEHAAPRGIYHATNAGHTTWYGLACAALELAPVAAPVAPVSSREFPQVARRPCYSVLDCSATEALVGAAPHWRDALGRALRAGLA